MDISIVPMTFADIPALSKIAGDSFENDRHTQMKASFGAKPYNHEEGSKSMLSSYLKSPNCVMLKAISKDTGESVGYIGWGFRGFEKDEIPRSDPGPAAPISTRTPTPITEKNQSSKIEEKNEEKEIDEDQEDEKIKKLVEFTDKEMSSTMRDLMPPGTKCIYVLSLSVSPSHQNLGIGSALLKYGTNICDGKDVFAWVHSSQDGWRAYEKAGFKEWRTFVLDLDEWAPGPPPDGEGEIWGKYVFRYGVYGKIGSESV